MTQPKCQLLDENHFGPADIRHLSLSITRLTLAAVGAANALKIVREMPLEECAELIDWLESFKWSSEGFWPSTVLPLLLRRLERPQGPSYQNSGNIFANVKSAIRLEDFAARFTDLEAAGKDRMRGRCPLHKERTPSFTVYVVSQRWQCFGACADGGDVITLAQKLMDRGLV